MGAGVPLLCGCRSLWCGGPPASSPLLTMVGLPLRRRSSSSGASHLLVVFPRGGGGLPLPLVVIRRCWGVHASLSPLAMVVASASSSSLLGGHGGCCSPV